MAGLSNIVEEDHRVLWRIAAVIGVACVALLVLGLLFAWPWADIGIGYQLLGILLAALGVPIVGPLVQRTAECLARRRRAIRRRMEYAREVVRRWWQRLRRRPADQTIFAGSAIATASASGELTVSRVRVDRSTVSERAWLAHLDDRLYWHIEMVEQMEARWRGEMDDLNRRMAEQRAELQQHTLAVTRQGWEFILGGVGLSFIGTFLGLF